MAKKKKFPFSVNTFLSTVDGGRTVASYGKNQKIFSQGERADSVFYIREGKVKVYVISEQGKEAVVALHGNGDFFGEGCLTGQPLRLATTVAMTECVIMRLDKVAIVRVLHDEPKFSELFMSYILARNARVEEDLVDQPFNSSEKAFGEGAPLDGALRQGGKAGADHSGEPRDARGNDRHHAVAREHLHEQVPQARVYQLQRRAGGPQFPAKCGLARQPPPQKEGRLNPALRSVWNSPAVLQVLDLRRPLVQRVTVNEQRTFRHVTFLPAQTRANLH
jgi:CRP-like cAMP-binding protein